MNDLYFARRPFSYGPGRGVDLDYGQVVELQGQKNDSKLLEYGHLAKFDTHGGRVTPVQCNKCGSKFADAGLVTAHGRKRHVQMDEVQFERFLEAEDKMLTRNAPLNEKLEEIGGASQPTISTEPAKKRRGRPKKVQPTV